MECVKNVMTTILSPLEFKRCRLWWSVLMVISSLETVKVTGQIQPIQDPVYWGAWSDWSECSSTCGQGVATRTRDCLMWQLGTVEQAETWRCQGRDTRRKLCNAKECEADAEDDSGDECRQFKTRNVYGFMQTWTRINKDNSCNITCQEKSTLSLRTIRTFTDGIACQLPDIKTAHCQRGECKPTVAADTSEGCSSNDGRQLQFDMCLICGGSNFSCYLVQAHSSKSTLLRGPDGSSIVVRVPQGSTFINIVKKGHFQNNLALLNSDGVYVINPPRHPSWPGKYNTEGTSWMYENDRHRESFTATGPTVGDVTILLAGSTQQDVAHSFWAPKTFALVPPYHASTEEVTDDDRHALSLPSDKGSLEDKDIWNILDTEIKSPTDKDSSPGQIATDKFPQTSDMEFINRIDTNLGPFLPTGDNRDSYPNIILAPEVGPKNPLSPHSGLNNAVPRPTKTTPRSQTYFTPKPDISWSGTSFDENGPPINSNENNIENKDYLIDNSIKRNDDKGDDEYEWSGQSNTVPRNNNLNKFDSSTDGLETSQNTIPKHGGDNSSFQPTSGEHIDNKLDSGVVDNIPNVNRRTEDEKTQNKKDGDKKKNSKRRGRKKKRKKNRDRKKKKKKNTNLPLKPAEECFPCPRAKDKIRQFCRSDFVSKVYVNRRKTVNEELRYDVTIISSYRNRVSLMQREFIWLESRCRCPNLKAKRTYIVMGRMKSFKGREARLVLSQRSFVRGFSLGQDRRMKRLAHTHICRA